MRARDGKSAVLGHGSQSAETDARGHRGARAETTAARGGRSRAPPWQGSVEPRGRQIVSSQSSPLSLQVRLAKAPSGLPGFCPPPRQPVSR